MFNKIIGIGIFAPIEPTFAVYFQYWKRSCRGQSLCILSRPMCPLSSAIRPSTLTLTMPTAVCVLSLMINLLWVQSKQALRHRLLWLGRKWSKVQAKEHVR